MATAAKLTVKKKPSMPPAASIQPIELSDSMRERIARKAYEFWQERGYRHGYELEDWLDAEIIVMEKIDETRV